MIQFLCTILAGRPAGLRPGDPADCWRLDPLSHPAIRRMTERERSDLPFDRERLAARDE